MLEVLLIWLVIFLISAPIGTAAIVILARCSDRQEKISLHGMLSFRSRQFINAGDSYRGNSLHFSVGACSIGGLVALTVYAEIYSLFAGVSAGAFLGAMILAALSCWYLYTQREGLECGELSLYRKRTEHSERNANLIWVYSAICYGGVIVICAYLTSRGYMHYDSDLYHAQAIRWIEEYGVVPGLANLHNRLGYNSAAFPLTALFSFRFVSSWLAPLGEKSAHVVQGYLYLMLWLECLKIFRIFQQKSGGVLPRLSLADFVRLAGIYYLFSSADEIVSPASDYFLVLVTFWILIRFLETDDWFTLALLAVAVVWTITIKLSGAMLLLLAVLPVIRLFRKRQWKSILLFTVTSVLVALPFFIRNVILTGYLVYPFPAINLFNLPWKVPDAAALADSREIMVWGRGYRDVTRYALPFSAWTGDWFRSQAGADRLFLIVAGVSVLIIIWGGILHHVADRVRCVTAGAGGVEARGGRAETGAKCVEARAGRGRDDCARTHHSRLNATVLTVEMTLIAAVVFWVKNGPLMRYGCVFVYSLAALNAGIILWYLAELWADPIKTPERYLRRAKVLHLAASALITAFIAYKVYAVGREVLSRAAQPYWVWQQDYGTYAVKSYEMNGITFYYPESGDQCGYAAFPSAPTRRDGDIMMMGDELADGFVSVR
ncbi:hypothetical protein SAMN02745687_01114 [Lachnospiraceae bacterium NK3A20]|nr:hypothetical protein SAMN02745687_01114 [Lachnospiraceae bacterium NK3A20]